MPTGLGDEQLWLSATNDNTGSSTAFNDQSGEGNDGTANGGMLVVADTSEGGTYAYDFDGTDDRIDCPSTVLGGSQEYSMSCWAYVDSHDATYGEGFMGQWSGTVSSNQVGIIYTGPATSFSGLVTAGGNNYSSAATGSSPPTGAWYHLASVVDGSDVTLYVDGVSQGSTPYTGSTVTSPTNAFEIGRYKGSAGASDRHCLNGKMDDVRAYQRALTQAEITHLASSRGVEGPPPVGLGDEQLWLCPSLNDSANDISGNGNDCTMQGGDFIAQDDGKDAFVFDGTTNYISVPAGIGSTSETNWSLSYWYYRNTSGAVHIFNLFGDGTYTNVGPISYYQGGANASKTYFGSRPQFVAESVGHHTTWTHVAMTVDTGSAKYYKDGVEVASGTTTTPCNMSLAGRIGTWATSLGSMLDGSLDDMRVFTKTLTQAEITHLASSRGVEGSPSTPTTQYNAFATHAFKQLFQTRLR